MSGEVFGDGPLYEFDVASAASPVTAEEAQSLFDAPHESDNGSPCGALY
jgi:hypothetical protein